MRFRRSRHLIFNLFIWVNLILGAGPAHALKVQIRKVAEGFHEPLHITHSRDGSGRLFIAEHAGAIRIIDKSGAVLPSPFIDLGHGGLDRVVKPAQESDERGLLGLAFHPQYGENGRFFVNYTRKGDSATIISEYKVSPTDPNLADPTETIIMGPIPQPQPNHNGGMVEFGPDGFLYIGLGDGGFRADVGNGHNPKIGNGQDTTTVLGKILRIDVDHPEGERKYGIPKDNPFATGADKNQPEIYAWGLRNPWRFSFDRADGRLFCGDLGQDVWEEIDVIIKGGNYGWRVMEGEHCFNPKRDCDMTGLIPPIHEYKHGFAGLSVTGGYVYRGKAFPNMTGLYFFADYSSGRIWSLTETAPNAWKAQEQMHNPFYTPTFGEDEVGELYTCNYWRGIIFQIVDGDVQPQPTETPDE